jgi:hypothetical protein
MFMAASVSVSAFVLSGAREANAESVKYFGESDEKYIPVLAERRRDF